MAIAIQTGAQLSFGDSGCPFGARTATVTTLSVSTVIPVGWWLCETAAHTTVEASYDGGTTYVTVVAASGAGFVYSDGYNVQFTNDSTGGTAGHYSQVLGV